MFSNFSLPVGWEAVVDNPATKEIEEWIHKILMVLLPLLCGLSIPPSLVNIILLLNFGILSEPSNILYLSLILLDLINCYLGLHLYFHHLDTEKSWNNYNMTLYLFAFDAYIVLILGLTLLRFLCVKMPASAILQNLHRVAWVTVLVAGLWGLFMVLYPRLIQWVTHTVHPDVKWFLWCDVGEVAMVALTVSLAFYTFWKVRYVFVSTHTYRSATYTCLLLVINYTISYSYYAVLNVARIYYTLAPNADPTSGVFPVFFFERENSVVIGLTFMCVQTLILNLILLSQDRCRTYLRRHTLMCWRDVKRKVESIGQPSEYTSFN